MQFAFRWDAVQGGHDNRRFGPPPSVQESWTKWRPVLEMVAERGLLKRSCRLAIVCGRGLVLSTEYRKAKEDIGKRAAEQATKRGYAVAEKGTPLALVGELYPPDRRRRDTLAYAKMLCDALEGVAYIDDSQVIDSRWVMREPDPGNPRIELRIEPVGVEQMGLGLGGPGRDRGFF